MLAVVKIETKKVHHLYIENYHDFIIILYFEFLIPHSGERMSMSVEGKKHQQYNSGKIVVIRGVIKMK
jgi:hypothetical protein